MARACEHACCRCGSVSHAVASCSYIVRCIASGRASTREKARESCARTQRTVYTMLMPSITYEWSKKDTLTMHPHPDHALVPHDIRCTFYFHLNHRVVCVFVCAGTKHPIPSTIVFGVPVAAVTLSQFSLSVLTGVAKRCNCSGTTPPESVPVSPRL